MNPDFANFHQLGEALLEALSHHSSKELALISYPQGAAPEKITGYRVEVPMYGWTAGFFFWRLPRLLPGVRHMLEVRIQFPQVKNMVFPLYSVLHHVAPDDLRCCCLTAITTEREMSASVRWLCSLLNDHMDQIDLLAQSPTPLLAAQRDELKAAFGNDIIAPHNESNLKRKLGGWYLTYHRRLTSVLYQEFLQGDYVRLRQSFQKAPPQNGFEQSLAEWLQTHDRAETPVLSPELVEMMTRLPEYPEDISEHPAARRSPWSLFGDLILGGLILTPFWLVVYGLLFALDFHWASQGVNFIIGMDWTEIIFCAWVTGFACAYCMLPQLIKLRYRKTSRLEEKLKDANRLSTPQAQPIFKAFVWIAVTMTAAHLYFYAHSGLAFSEKGFYDRTGTLSIVGEYIPYSQVRSLALEHSTYEMFGVEYSSQDYVLTLKDGSSYYLGAEYGAGSKVVIDQIAPLLEAVNPDSVNDEALREG